MTTTYIRTVYPRARVPLILSGISDDTLEAIAECEAPSDDDLPERYGTALDGSVWFVVGAVAVCYAPTAKGGAS